MHTKKILWHCVKEDISYTEALGLWTAPTRCSGIKYYHKDFASHNTDLWSQACGTSAYLLILLTNARIAWRQIRKLGFQYIRIISHRGLERERAAMLLASALSQLHCVSYARDFFPLSPKLHREAASLTNCDCRRCFPWAIKSRNGREMLRVKREV